MRELLLDKETILAKNVIEPHLDDHAVLVSVHYSYISSGVQASLLADAKRNITTFGNVPQKIKSLLSSLITAEKSEKEGSGKNTPAQSQLPLLGYSCSGQVIAVGKKVTTFKTGDFVACLGGDYIQYQDIVCVPVSCVASLRNAEFLKKGSVVALGANALHAVRLAQLQIGEVVCVLGLGVIGQCIAQLAKESGCTVVGIDLLKDRITIALESGIEYVFDKYDDALKIQIGILTQNKGFDVTFIAASDTSEGIMEAAIEFTRQQGKIVISGTIGMNMPKEFLHKKELIVMMMNSTGIGSTHSLYNNSLNEVFCSATRWAIQSNMQTVIHMIEKGSLQIDKFIEKEEALQDFDKTYFDLKNRKILGVVLKYSEKHDYFLPATIDYSTVHAPKFKNIEKNKVAVGIVGAACLDQNYFLPALSKMSSITINAISDCVSSQTQSLAHKMGATKIFTHEEKLYKDHEIDAVIIASSDRLHTQQALSALSIGKAVFMVRPMVTNFEEYEQFASYLKRSTHVPLCVEYSYSFCPLIQKIKWEVAQRISPLMIHYRVTQDIGFTHQALQRGNAAGNVISQACAIFELFSFLTDSYPVAVSVEALRSSSKNSFPTDNFSVQLSFSDGSVCSLLYTTLGYAPTSRDYMEIFFDGKTIEMTDFISLKGYGTSARNFDTKLNHSDRGAEELLRRFFTGIKDPAFKMPFSTERLSQIAYLTLVVDKLVCQGGGTEKIE